MARRLFVCHANAEIESTSEVVDSLENALDFPEGSLLTSSLPGYSPDAHKEEALSTALDVSLMLALVSETSVKDAVFNFELGAAWARGVRTIAVVLGDPATLHLPWPLQNLPQVRANDADEWTSLIGELSLRLGLVPRPAASQPPSLYPPAPAAVSSAPAYVPREPEPAQGYLADLPLVETLAASEIPQPFAASEPPPPAASYIPEPPAPIRSSAPPSDVYARPPSCEISLEAGRAASDCLYNRSEISDFASELSKPLGRLVDALGGSWDELRDQQDFDGWLETTETLLRNLPSEARKVEDWYKLGFELAILHNIAGQLVLDGTDTVAEQQWREALERFLVRAEKADIGYENLGRVLSLLENLAGPSAERDLGNIARSLEELRRYAVHADGIHTAA